LRGPEGCFGHTGVGVFGLGFWFWFGWGGGGEVVVFGFEGDVCGDGVGVEGGCEGWGGRVVVVGRLFFGVGVWLFGWCREGAFGEPDGDVELGVVGEGRGGIEVFSLVVECGVELDGCISVGCRVCEC
jgi:hypothetical protein